MVYMYVFLPWLVGAMFVLMCGSYADSDHWNSFRNFLIHNK